ncbi:MAG: ATP-binding protein [Phycisphaerales bacterium]|nr:ATP-binding protein [Phycisphaerales bacterium]
MTVIQQLTAAQAVEHAIHFGFPNRHCERMKNGLKWNQYQKNTFQIVNPLLESGGIVLIHGVRGNGKTQIGAGLGCIWWKRGYHIQRGKARYWTLPDLFTKQKQTFTESKVRIEPLQLARECGLLVIDEIDTDQNSGYDKRELRDLIDTRYRENQKPTLLLTNVKPEGLKDALDYSILDRIREDGAFVQLLGSSYRRNDPNQ